MKSCMNLIPILAVSLVIFEVLSCEFRNYNDIEMTPGIQFTGAVQKSKPQTSMMECVVFCLDSDTFTFSADFCGGHCNCYSQSQTLADSVANTTCTGITMEFNNCFDILKSLSRTENGIYNITIKGTTQDVYCDMDNGGWTVIQQRYDGSVDFYRSYQNYQDGFGNVNGEYWLGLDKIHDMLSSNQYKVRFDLENFNEEKAFAEYNIFRVANGANNYKLEISGYYGNAGDGMLYHNGSYFSAGSVDNDFYVGNCAKNFQAGWWFKKCFKVNINGLYNKTQNWKGLIWDPWRGSRYSLKSTSMKIKPKG